MTASACEVGGVNYGLHVDFTPHHMPTPAAPLKSQWINMAKLHIVSRALPLAGSWELTLDTLVVN